MSAGIDGGRPHRPREVPLRLVAFVLLGPPLAWTAHFALVFVLVMVSCRAGSTGADVWILLSAFPFLSVSVAAAVAGRRAHRAVDASLQDELDGRSRVVALLLELGVAGAVVFSLVVALESLSPLFLSMCAGARP